MERPLMRKINLKALLVVLGGCILLTGIVFGVHYLQRQRIASALLWQARKAEENSQMERLVRFLGRYLDFRPDDLEEKARLGRTLLSSDLNSSTTARNRAVNLLDDVLRQQPDRDEDRRILVKGALSLPNKTKLARESLTLLLDPNKPDLTSMSREDLGELEGYWGALFEQEGQYREAITWCRKAIKNRPDEQINFLRLAYLLRREGNEDPQQREANLAESNQVMNQLVERNSTSSPAYLARWRYRREFNLIAVPGRPAEVDSVPFEEGIKDVREALKLTPENLEVLLASADVERLQSDRKTALVHLRRAVEILARQGRTNPNDLHVQQVHWQMANVLLDNALIQQEDLAARDANLAEVQPSLEILRKSTPMRGAADYVEGRLKFQKGHWPEATTFLEKARTQLSDKRELVAQIDLVLGQCYEKLDEPARMYESFKRLVAYDANSTAGQVGMASALWMQGRLDDALVIYQQLVNADRMPAASWMDVARLELTRQLQLDPAERDWTNAEKAMDAAEKAAVRSFEVSVIRVELLAAQEKYQQAEELLARAIQEKPAQEADLWVLRADLARRQKKPEQVQQILEAASKSMGDSVTLRLGRVQMAQANPEQARQALQAAEKGMEKLPIEEQSKLLEGLAAAYFRLGDEAEARRLTERMALMPQHRGDSRLQLLLLDMALRAQDDAGVERALEALRTQENGTGTYTTYGLALREMGRARRLESSDKNRDAALEEARRQLDKVARARPSWAPIHTARAEMYEIQGNLEQSIVELRQAMANGDNSPAVIQRLVRALLQRQRDNEADVELKKLQGALIASSSELGKLAAIMALRKGDSVRAISLARNVVNGNNKDFRDQIWMARMQAAAGKFDDAEKSLVEATKKTPNEPEPWVALVQFLAGRKREEEAATTLKEAATKVTPTRKPLLLALGLEALGKVGEAVLEIQKAEEADPGNLMVIRHAVRFYLRTSRLDLAEASLRRVLSGNLPKATTEDRDWARRGLALTLANGTDFTRFREALTLVGLPLDDKGQLPRDNPKERINSDLMRTQARVLATQPQNSYRGRAIELFERLDRIQALNDEDRMMLAMLLDRNGNWAKAREHYTQLALKPNMGPQPVLQLTMGLLRQKELITAEQFLRQLETMEKDRKVEPGSYGSRELRSRLMEERSDLDRAFDLLKQHVEREGSAAEERLALVAFCSRHKRLDQGLKLCIAARETCKPEAVSGATVALLRANNGTEEQCKEVQTWLLSTIKENPKKLVLRMHLANLYDYRGMYREAEEQYRELLKPGNEPNNIVALNNLAWLLALQVGKAEQALEIVTKAIQSAGRRPELLDTRGVILLNMGRVDEALVDLKEAAVDAPNPTRLFHLARAYHTAKDRENATRTMRKAREMGLETESMHPVEQEACKKLLTDLKL